ncbi:hypothetical protein CFIICLFH_1617 [Methylobacterium goesingense]|nr:hypothetical protein CFIICLFH_1617 [Methylobacterium goesingense]
MARDVDQRGAHGEHVVLRDHGVGVDVARQDLDLGGDLAGGRELEALAAHPARRQGEARVVGVGREHVLPLDAEGRRRQAECAAEQVELGTDFVADAGLGLERHGAGHREGVGADIGPEAGAHVGVEGELRQGLVDEAGARRGCHPGLVDLGRRGALAEGLLEEIEAHAEQGFPLRAERDLVLGVEGRVGDPLQVVAPDGERRQGLAVARIVDVEAVGALAEVRAVIDHAAVGALALEAEKHGMAEIAGGEAAHNLGLADGGIPAVIAKIPVAQDGAIVGSEATDLRRFPDQRAGVEVGRQPHLPVGVEAMLDPYLHRVRALVRALPGLAEEAGDRQESQLLVDRDHAPVEDDAVAQELGLDGDLRVRRDLPAHHGRDEEAVAIHEIAKAVLAAARDVEAVEQRAVLVECAAGIDCATELLERAPKAAHLDEALGRRLLGDEVDEAARVAAPEQAAAGALEHLDALHVLGIG